MEIHSVVETAARRAPLVMVFITGIVRTRQFPASCQRVGSEDHAIFLEGGSSPI